MDAIQINVYAFLGILEFTLLLLVASLVLFVRGKNLMRWQRLARKKLKEMKQLPQTVTFEQYLREELNRNQRLTECVAGSQDDVENKAVELMKLREQYLELELQVRAWENDQNVFRESLVAGLGELIERLRPEAQTATDAGVDVSEIIPQREESAAEQQRSEQRRLIDTHDAEFDRLKEVINNQQDDRHVLESKLRELEALLEFKDATIEELEKQNKKREANLRAAAGGKSVDRC